MSGLLRRLARQALGAGGPTIHSQARMPYAVTLAWAQDHAETPIQPPEHPADFRQALAPDPPAAPTTAPQTEEPGSGPGLSYPGQPQQTGQVRSALPRQRGALEHPSEPITPEIPTADNKADNGNPFILESGLNSATLAQELRHGGSSRPLVQDGVQENTFAPNHAASFGRSPGTGQAVNATSTGEHLGSFPDSQLRGRALPTPLLEQSGPKPGEAPAHAAPRSDGASRPTPAAAQQATEVHVHIGRIEVTAFQESKDPRRTAPSPRRQPMSLEEYLAKRREGVS